MPKVVFTHPVKDVAHWMSKHSERVELFAHWGSNLVDYAPADDSNTVALSIDVHDMEAMQAALTSEDLEKGKEAHGVLEPISMFLAPE